MTASQSTPAKSASFPSLLGVLLVINLVACVMAGAAAWMGWRSLSLTTDGQVATGTVVRLVEDDPNEIFTGISPVVEFEANGETYEVRSQNTYQWWDRYLRFPVGRQVEVRYDPANPATAEINSWVDLWVEPLCLGGFTLIFVLVANAFMLMRWRAGRKPPTAAHAL